MYQLKEDYAVYGTEITSLLNEIREMEEKTSYVTVEAKDITLNTFVARHKDVYAFRKISNEKILDEAMTFIKRPEEPLDDELLNESINNTGVIITALINGRKRAMYVSPHGITAMAEKAGVGGPRIKDPSYFRDLYIAEGLFNKDKVKLVLRREDRENGQVYKLFGVLSEKYKNISLEIIPETIKTLETDTEMGSSEFRQWKNTQSYTEAIIEFPDAADELQAVYALPKKMIPGVRISTSDIGEASLRVQGTYRTEGARTFTVNSEVKRNHTGKVEMKDIINDVKKEIYSQFKYVPEKLAFLMGKTIGNEDLTSENGRNRNKALAEKAVRKGIRALHISKTIGQKRAKELEASLTGEISGKIQYTEFDIAMMFMTIGDRIIGLPDNARKMLEKAVADAPFIRYQNDKDEEEIALLPEEV